MQHPLKFITILLILGSCIHKGNDVEKVNGDKQEIHGSYFKESVISVCHVNSIDTFDMSVLQTDKFKGMLSISKNVFQNMFPKRKDYTDSSFFVYSYIPNEFDYLTLIIYQKNYEGENYRVDKMELVNIDSNGRSLDRITLATIDNAVITYEINSIIYNNDTLKVIEKVSSEPYFNPDHDTLYTNQYVFRINTASRIDTISQQHDFEINEY